MIAQTGLFKSQPNTNFVFPNAPSIPITVNAGMRMPGWFDIYEFNNANAKQDEDGFYKSCEYLKSLITEQHEKHQIPFDQIVIGGFSQGAAVSMATLAMLDQKIGGLVALSGFLPAADSLKQKVQSANFSTPVFQGHGDLDPLIQLPYGEKTAEFFKGLGFTNWKFNVYEGVPHSADNAELLDVVKFLAKVLD